jgi:hypothetical protein
LSGTVMVDAGGGSYAQLKESTDGGYYNLKCNTLKFVYNEEYNNSGVVDYAIYDASDTKVYPPGASSLSITTMGKNLFALNLSTAGLSTGYYLFEVKNKKGDKQYLRFKY